MAKGIFKQNTNTLVVDNVSVDEITQINVSRYCDELMINFGFCVSIVYNKVS